MKYEAEVSISTKKPKVKPKRYLFTKKFPLDRHATNPYSGTKNSFDLQVCVWIPDITPLYPPCIGVTLTAGKWKLRLLFSDHLSAMELFTEIAKWLAEQREEVEEAYFTVLDEYLHFQMTYERLKKEKETKRQYEVICEVLQALYLL